jgi:hypothetical protein
VRAFAVVQERSQVGRMRRDQRSSPRITMTTHSISFELQTATQTILSSNRT